MNRKIAAKRTVLNFLLLLIGFIFFFFSLNRLYVERYYSKKGDKVQAQVVNILIPPRENEDPESYDQRLADYQRLRQRLLAENVIKKTTRRAVIVAFEHSDKLWQRELTSDTDRFKIGEEVLIYVKPNDSLKFILPRKSAFGIYLLLILGVILLGAETFVLFSKLKEAKRIRRIIKTGEEISAEILYADLDEKKKYFTRHPFIFTCVADKGTAAEKIYRSQSIYTKNAGRSYIGKDVKIYLKDDDNYFVDEKEFEKE